MKSVYTSLQTQTFNEIQGNLYVIEAMIRSLNKLKITYETAGKMDECADTIETAMLKINSIIGDEVLA